MLTETANSDWKNQREILVGRKRAKSVSTEKKVKKVWLTRYEYRKIEKQDRIGFEYSIWEAEKMKNTKGYPNKISLCLKQKLG